jgi:hypothetical protein
VIYEEGVIYYKDMYGDSRTFSIGQSLKDKLEGIKNYCVQNYEHSFEEDLYTYIIENTQCNVYNRDYVNNYYDLTNYDYIPYSWFNGQHITNNANIYIPSSGIDYTKSFIPKMDLNNAFKYDGYLSINTSKNHKYFGFLNDLDRSGIASNNRGVYGFM